MKERLIWRALVLKHRIKYSDFHLSKPCVYFLELLRLPVYTPSCSKYAKETGSGWDKIQRPVCQTDRFIWKICTRAIFCPEKE